MYSFFKCFTTSAKILTSDVDFVYKLSRVIVVIFSGCSLYIYKSPTLLRILILATQKIAPEEEKKQQTWKTNNIERRK